MFQHTWKTLIDLQGEFRYNLKLAWPIMLSQLGQVSVNFVDNIMIGRVGSTSLAAVSLGNSLFVVFLVFGLGLSFGLTPLVAQAEGASERKSIKVLFIHSILINLCFASLSAIAIYLLSPCMYHMDQPEAVVPLAIDYVKIVGISLIPFMIFQTFRTLAEGISYTKLVFSVTIIGNLVNVVANYTLIFGNFGLPELGIRGAAIGTLLARAVMVICMFLAFRYWSPVQSYLAQLSWDLHRSVFKKIWDLGLPTGLSMLFEVSAFAASTFIIGTMGEAQLAAHQIALNLASTTFLLATGFSIVSTIRVGNKLGEKQIGEARRVGFANMVQAGLFMMVCAIVFIVFRHTLPEVYIDDEQITSIASQLLIVAALFQIVDGLQVTAMGSLRGLQEVLRPAIITFISYWVIALPLGYWLGHYKGMEAAGVWIGLWIGLSIAAVLLIFRFHRSSALLKQKS